MNLYFYFYILFSEMGIPLLQVYVVYTLHYIPYTLHYIPYTYPTYPTLHSTPYTTLYTPQIKFCIYIVDIIHIYKFAFLFLYFIFFKM